MLRKGDFKQRGLLLVELHSPSETMCFDWIESCGFDGEYLSLEG
jgi:hypothetical protein